MKLNRYLLVLFLFLLNPSSIVSHCEIPCGIYDDAARLQLLAEHIGTVEKSIITIEKLSSEKSANYNQIVRWVNNKEEHANEIQHIVTEYFMTQRIKPIQKSDKKAYGIYIKQITLLHSMVVHAMKAKQSLDLGNVKKLSTLLKEFKNVYPVKQ